MFDVEVSKEARQVLSNKLKEYRERNNLTQKDMADALGITVRAYSSYENCKAYPHSGRLLLITKILKNKEILQKELDVEYLIYQMNDLKQKLEEKGFDVKVEINKKLV